MPRQYGDPPFPRTCAAYALLAAAVALVAAFAVYVWPTRYWYTSVDVPRYDQPSYRILVRVDRLTNAVAKMDTVNGVWQPLGRRPLRDIARDLLEP